MSANPNDSAFPLLLRNNTVEYGLTKLEHIAEMAMQGICANPSFLTALCDLANKNNTHVEKLVASSSVELAKALIAELNKEGK